MPSVGFASIRENSRPSCPHSCLTAVRCRPEVRARISPATASPETRCSWANVKEPELTTGPELTAQYDRPPAYLPGEEWPAVNLRRKGIQSIQARRLTRLHR